MFRQRPDILDQMLSPVLLNVGRFARKIVPTHVRRDRQMVPSKLRQLVFPLVPELRKPVQEEDQGPCSGTHIVQPNSVHLGVLMSIHAVAYQYPACLSTTLIIGIALA